MSLFNTLGLTNLLIQSHTGIDLNAALGETPTEDDIAKSLNMSTGGMVFHVSSAIKNQLTSDDVYVVVLENHNKFWWFKNEYITCRVATMKGKMTAQPLSWMDTNVTFNRRNQEHGANNYAYRQNGGLKNLIRFLITIPSDSDKTIKSEMATMVRVMEKMFTSPSIDKAARAYVECINIAMPAFLKTVAKVKKDESLMPVHMQKLEEQAANGLTAMTSTPATINYDMPLDKYFMDSDIKSFLVDCGYEDWGDYQDNLEESRKIFRSGKLKKWGDMVYVPY